MTSTATLTLTDFLLARIAEDEAAARTCAAVYPPPWGASDRGWVAYVKADAPHFREVARLEQDHIAREDKPEWLGDAIAHIARWDPARVLAECEAKRRIVAELSSSNRTSQAWLTNNRDDILSITANCLRLLTLPYADHPAYRQEWRP